MEETLLIAPPAGQMFNEMGVCHRSRLQVLVLGADMGIDLLCNIYDSHRTHITGTDMGFDIKKLTRILATSACSLGILSIYLYVIFLLYYAIGMLTIPATIVALAGIFAYFIFYLKAIPTELAELWPGCLWAIIAAIVWLILPFMIAGLALRLTGPFIFSWWH